jgi:lipopolysaccharide assembly LptE-like protein
MKVNKKIKFILAVAGLSIAFLMQQSCHVYSFRNISIPDSVKTVKVNFIENRARYVNPQLSPRLTDGLRQKIVRQTRLSQTNTDDAHWDIKGEINDYSLSTSGISDQKVASNRLNVSVHITLNDRLANEVKEYNISRSFDFSASLSLQAAEAKLSDEIIRSLSDDIFNQIFSNW